MDEEQLTRPQIVYTGKHEDGRGTVNSTSDSAYRYTRIWMRNS